jgi:predicted nucleic acid-binding protein
MAVLLLDSTIWLAARDDRDPAHPACVKTLTTSEHDLAALDLTLYETANVAAAKWHDYRQAQEIGERILGAVADRLIRIDAELHEHSVQLARQHSLTMYDAAYAAASQSYGFTLVSLDADLLTPGLAVDPSAF